MNNFFQNFSALSKWKDKFKKIPWLLGRHAFYVVLVLALFSVILGGFLFYNYAVRVTAQDLKVSENSLKFRQDLYNKILEQWRSKE